MRNPHLTTRDSRLAARDTRLATSFQQTSIQQTSHAPLPALRLRLLTSCARGRPAPAYPARPCLRAPPLPFLRVVVRQPHSIQRVGRWSLA
jgi:hypothetical protein